MKDTLWRGQRPLPVLTEITLFLRGTVPDLIKVVLDVVVETTYEVGSIRTVPGRSHTPTIVYLTPNPPLYTSTPLGTPPSDRR